MAIVVDGGWEMVGISTSISRSDLTETLGDSERFLRRTSDAAHHLDPRGCCDLRTKKYGLYVERKVVSPITSPSFEEAGTRWLYEVTPDVLAPQPPADRPVDGQIFCPCRQRQLTTQLV